MRWRKRRKTWRTPDEWIRDHWPKWWFAWYPVELSNGEIAWLERVIREKERKYYDGVGLFGQPTFKSYTVTTYHSLN